MLFTAGALKNSRKCLLRVYAQEGYLLRVPGKNTSEEKALLFIPFENVETSKLPHPDPGQLLGFAGSESSPAELRSGTHEYK